MSGLIADAKTLIDKARVETQVSARLCRALSLTQTNYKSAGPLCKSLLIRIVCSKCECFFYFTHAFLFLRADRRITGSPTTRR